MSLTVKAMKEVCYCLRVRSKRFLEKVRFDLKKRSILESTAKWESGITQTWAITNKEGAWCTEEHSV